MRENVELVLLYCFESPKKNWTLLTFGQLVDGDLEKGMKPLEMWYPKKGILDKLTPEDFGNVVEATLTLKVRDNDISKAESIVESFVINDSTINLV